MKESVYNYFHFSKKAKILIPALLFAALSSCTKPEVAETEMPLEKNTDEPQITTLTDRYIVVLKSDKHTVSVSDPQFAQIQQILQDKHIDRIAVSEADKLSGAINGFVAVLTPEQARAMRSSAEVEYMEQDQVILLSSNNTKGNNGNGKGNTYTPPPTSTTTTTTTTATTATTSIITTTTSTTVTTDIRVNGEVIPWGVTRMGARGASGVGKTAWIIDSGIDFGHTDLNVDKTRSKSFLCSTDGGLYSSPTDELGHGTAVAGIIGAKANGAGIVGVAPGASLVSLKVVSRTGYCTVSNMIRAIDWAYTYAKPGDVVNISLQANASTLLDDAVKRLAAKGVYVTIGSGNSAADCSTKSPQRVNAVNVFTISAMNNDNTFWTGSNYGAPVDFTAPGTKILTAELGGTFNYVSGTSFSAPHLAGLLLINSGLTRVDGYVLNDPDTRKDGIAHK